MKASRLVIATTNAGKVREIAEQLRRAIDVRLAGLSDYPLVAPVAENGTTFRENAEAKARGYAAQLGCHVLADDSGLEVDALSGRPGVFSARYGGPTASDAERLKLLLEELRSAGLNASRTARFVCVLALADPAGILYTWRGVCEGEIAREPRGAGGFGYDPVFIPAGHQLTFGELSSEIKQKISHRALALSAALPFLRRLFGAPAIE